VGIAYSLTAGTYQPILDSALSKRMQPGFAARAAVEAIAFANRGITGSRDILEGQYGYYPLYERGDYDRTVLTRGLGVVFEGMATSMKPYPSCRFCHGVVDAVLAISKTSRFTPEEVDSITANVPSEVHALVGNPFRRGPSAQVSAQFSLAYNIAVALLRGTVGLREFDQATLSDPEVIKLAGRVRSVDNGDCHRFGPQEVIIYLKNGSVLSHVNPIMKGHPNNPMTDIEALSKARDCLVYAGKSPVMADNLVRCVQELELQPNLDRLYEIASAAG
jgi:2-methylcitrate dehydratase PrpD